MSKSAEQVFSDKKKKGEIRLRKKVLSGFILLLFLTMMGDAGAICTPTPDCEALGYKATSCVGGGVKCPWDATKMYCNPNMN